MNKQTPKDWYSEVTEGIIDLLDKGEIPWRKPWHGEMISGQSGKPYNGINEVQLQVAAIRQGFESSLWFTFNEAKNRGGFIRKGEHGVPIFKWVVIEKKEEADKGEQAESHKFMRMAYAGSVFNLAQTEGVELHGLPIAQAEFCPLESAEAIYANMPLKPLVQHGGVEACYIPSLDTVQMPNRVAFLSEGAYYSTLYHELAHSTGHAMRLGRKEVTDPTRFGSHNYSVEELVAEFTAALLCAKVGLSQPELKQNSAAYIQSWSRKLKEDKSLIVHAAQRAQKAVNYILNVQPQEVTL